MRSSTLSKIRKPSGISPCSDSSPPLTRSANRGRNIREPLNEQMHSGRVSASAVDFARPIVTLHQEAAPVGATTRAYLPSREVGDPLATAMTNHHLTFFHLAPSVWYTTLEGPVSARTIRVRGPTLNCDTSTTTGGDVPRR
ncbi:hypothetical protein KM043_010231 [Ampulex compressa]|nr:hypothetical protein KM043_010231 [Ampulex compressa]